MDPIKQAVDAIIKDLSERPDTWKVAIRPGTSNDWADIQKGTLRFSGSLTSDGHAGTFWFDTKMGLTQDMKLALSHAAREMWNGHFGVSHIAEETRLSAKRENDALNAVYRSLCADHPGRDAAKPSVASRIKSFFSGRA